MKKILKFFGVLIIANIKKIIILVGILMISSFSYYGAVDENGEKVISFEPNATQNPVELQSEVVNESKKVQQEESKQEIVEIKEQPKEEVKPIKIEQKEKNKENTQQKKVETQKVSTPKVEEKTVEKEVVIKQPEEKQVKEEIKQEEIKQEQYSEVEVKIVEKSECIDNNHKVGIGNSNKWFNSQDEAIAEYNAELEKWSQKAKSGAISYEELYQKCPYGYETWNCYNCKKWTLNYYYN